MRPGDTGFGLLLFPPADTSRAMLGDWLWLLARTGKQYRLLATTLFGQLFLESASGEIDYLDILDGDITTVASSRQDLDRVLRDTAEGRELLMAELCELLWERGIRPGPGQCYGYKVPPVLGALRTRADFVELVERNETTKARA